MYFSMILYLIMVLFMCDKHSVVSFYFEIERKPTDYTILIIPLLPFFYIKKTRLNTEIQRNLSFFIAVE